MKQTYRTGDQSLVREINLASLLKYLNQGKSLSRAKLAALTGLNKTTVSSLVEELISRGLVCESGLDASGAGRPATLLELSPNAGSIIGVEMGVDFISVIQTDFLGQILWQSTRETNPLDPQNEIIAQALQMVDDASAASQVQSQRLLGLGLTLPGMVDVQSGVLLFSPNLRWRDINLRQIFSDHTGLPVFVENDANASAIGEHFFGVAQRAQHFIFLSMGVGIGAGLFLGGELYRGAGGIAGEVGHTNLLSESNRPCRCGNRGCWETSGNQFALFERVRALLNVGQPSAISELMSRHDGRVTLPIIAQAAIAGDLVALEALAETGEAIGLGVANLIDIFNPELVVLGGAMSVVGNYLLPTIQATVEAHALAETRRQMRLVLSKAGPAASVVGAVALVFENVLANPVRVTRLSDHQLS